MSGVDGTEGLQNEGKCGRLASRELTKFCITSRLQKVWVLESSLGGLMIDELMTSFKFSDWCIE